MGISFADDRVAGTQPTEHVCPGRKSRACVLKRVGILAQPLSLVGWLMLPATDRVAGARKRPRLTVFDFKNNENGPSPFSGTAVEKPNG